MREGHGDRSGSEAFEQEWRERFSEFAEERDDDAGIAGWSTTGLDARMRRFVGLWRTPSLFERWLDAGCGAGTYSRLLLDDKVQVFAIDYSLPSIRKARARSPSAIDFAVSDVRRLPFASGSFDGVVCFGVMQALGESAPALSELSNMVRPGGQIWVDGLNRACVINVARRFWRRLRGRAAHLRYERPEAIASILRAQGFDEVDIYWMPIAPPRWPGLQRIAELPSFTRLLEAAPKLASLLCHAFIVRGRKAMGTKQESTVQS